MAGKTKQGINFARLRQNASAPKAPIAPFSDFPSNGVLDFSQQLEFQRQRKLTPTLFENLLPLISPLSAVSYTEENAQAWRQRAAEDFKLQPAAAVQINPDKSRPREWEDSRLLPGQVLFTPVTDYWLGITRPGLDPSPEQRLTLEVITPDKNLDPQLQAGREADFELYGVAYWAYDPLNSQWLLINRWGADDIPFQTLNAHAAMYQQSQQAELRMSEIAEDLTQRPVGDPDLILRVPSLAERIKVLTNKQQLLNFIARLPEDHAIKEINQIKD